jgi:integrase
MLVQSLNTLELLLLNKKMAEDDIYGSKGRYEQFKSNLTLFTIPPSERKLRHKYYCRNPENLKYFKMLFMHFEAKDLSFIRRLRILQTFKFVVYHTTKNLKNFNRKDIDKILARMHVTHKSSTSKETFIKDLKHVWKILFPDTDEKGRPDETIVPYTVRHISGKIDKSRQKLRSDKLTWEEFEQIVDYFSNDPRIQLYLTLSLESLVRPQELLYVRLENVERYDSYAKVLISEHGKEGTGLLQCIDSYPYLIKWLDQHPQKNNGKAFLFVNTGNTNTLKQLKPSNINKMIRKACKDLKINKPITCYSLKRNGVTMRRLRGESDMEIQHAARWTSTKQLKTYDLSSQDEAFKLALEKRGLIKQDKYSENGLKAKICFFCKEKAGFSEINCPKCKRPLDRDTVLEQQKKDEEIQQLKVTIESMDSKFDNIKQEILRELTEEILQKVTIGMSANKATV